MNPLWRWCQWARQVEAPVQTGPEGLALLREFEGCRLNSYKDLVGVWTIGYGHTGHEVGPGLAWTQDWAEAQLKRDLGLREVAVGRAVTVQLSQTQFDALVCLVYNIGEPAFRRSSLLKLLNVGDFKLAANEFPKWDRAGGHEVAGLRRRREAERALFLKGVT